MKKNFKCLTLIIGLKHGSFIVFSVYLKKASMFAISVLVPHIKVLEHPLVCREANNNRQ